MARGALWRPGHGEVLAAAMASHRGENSARVGIQVERGGASESSSSVKSKWFREQEEFGWW